MIIIIISDDDDYYDDDGYDYDHDNALIAPHWTAADDL